MHRHRQTRARATKPVDERRRGGMERRAAKAANHQERRERPRVRRKADQAQNRHGGDRSGQHEQPRPPAVGQAAEPELGDRVRHLEQHLECPRGRKRQAELRDQQRQERRVDVAVAVNDEVGAREQKDGGV